MALRNFAQAKEDGFFPIIHCGTSYGHYKEVREELLHPPKLRDQTRRVMDKLGKPMVFPEEVVHYSEWVHVMRNEIAQRQVLDLSPDAILIGFAMNDASVAGYRDKDFSGQRDSDSLAKGARRFLEKIELLKLLRYLGRSVRHESWSIGDYMGKLAEAAGTPAEAWMGGQGTESADYQELEPYTRVAPSDYERTGSEPRESYRPC